MPEITNTRTCSKTSAPCAWKKLGLQLLSIEGEYKALLTPSKINSRVGNSNCITAKPFPLTFRSWFYCLPVSPIKGVFLDLFLPVWGLSVPFTTSFSRNGRMWTTRKSRELGISDAERIALCASWKLLRFPSSLIVKVSSCNFYAGAWAACCKTTLAWHSAEKI